MTIAPNPARAKVSISYELAGEEFVQLEVYNTMGQRIQVLSEGLQEQGSHTIQYATEHLSDGMYYIYLKLGDEVITKPVMIMR